MTAPTMPAEATRTAGDRLWRTRAACRDKDPDLWFPEGNPKSNYVHRQYAAARKVCVACPVRLDCLIVTDANESGSRQHRGGMAGGLTPEQRANPATVAAVLRWLEGQRERAAAR